MKRRRIAKTTVFFYGEGETEESFLEHLRGLYAQGKTAPKIDHNGGGSPSAIINKAIRVRSIYQPYAASIIVCDADKAPEDSDFGEARVTAESLQFKLLLNRPCVEALFLAIIDPGIPWRDKTTSDCEKVFYPKYAKEKPVDRSDCEKLFPKKLLDESRKRIPDLNLLIGYFEGVFA